MDENNLQDRDWDQEKILTEISRILIDLMKTIKVVSVYPEDNPLPAKLRESFVGRFTDIIEELGGLQFTIVKGEIQYKGSTVYIDRPPDDRLAGIFHDSGITRISFSNEFSFEEANAFFKAMKAYVNKEEGAEDLVATFWQAAIFGFDYGTLEDINLSEYEGEIVSRETVMEDGSRFDNPPDIDSLQYSSIFLDGDSSGIKVDSDGNTDGEGGGGIRVVDGVGDYYVLLSEDKIESGEVVLKGDSLPHDQEQKIAESQMGMAPVPDQKRVSLPDAALILNDTFSLGDSESEQAAKLIAEDERLDVFGRVVDLLMEMLLQESEFSSFNETVIITEKIQAEFVRMCILKPAGDILSRLKEVDNLLPERAVQWKERIRNALIMAGGWEKLSHLATMLNQNPSVSGEKLIEYMEHFGWEAISAIMDLLGELEHRHHRLATVDFLINAGKDYVDIISKGLFDRRWFVVRNTALILGEIGNDRALSYLEKAIRHEDPRVHQEMIKGLTKPENIKNLDILIRLLWDADVVGKQTILKKIINENYDGALGAIVKIINDDRFATLKESEKERLVMGFSSIGGEYAISYLNSLISKKKFSSEEAKLYYRKLAFKALSQNLSEAAGIALKNHARSRKSDVRKMANEAIRLRNNILARTE